ncbi:MAG: hypothetical protein CYG59_04920 [Chloroflexi bacterium]|nr:MAG: hypothetical protein CYG59_04920 [Chloroflexota bacterium]
MERASMKSPAWITRLLRDGTVPRSAVTSESVAVLEQLVALGYVTEETQGARRRVVVRNGGGFDTWVAGTYPQPSESAMPGRRAGNIARVRDSKGGRSTHDRQPMLLRWFDPDPAAPFAALTQQWGVAAVTSDRCANLIPPSRWILLTVENWESFIATDYTGCQDAIIVLYTGGNPAEATIQALGSLHPAPVRAIHFGDYDWSGLAIFRRLRAELPTIELYVPEDVEALMRKYGNPGVIDGQIPLRKRDDDTDAVREVIRLISWYNAGLEQESVAPPKIRLPLEEPL